MIFRLYVSIRKSFSALNSYRQDLYYKHFQVQLSKPNPWKLLFLYIIQNNLVLLVCKTGNHWSLTIDCIMPFFPYDFSVTSAIFQVWIFCTHRVIPFQFINILFKILYLNLEDLNPIFMTNTVLVCFEWFCLMATDEDRIFKDREQDPTSEVTDSDMEPSHCPALKGLNFYMGGPGSSPLLQPYLRDCFFSLFS